MDSGGSMIEALIGLGFFVTMLAIALAMIAGYWRMYEKADQPGWACLIPIYNIIVMLRMGGLSGWLILGLMIPIVNLILMFVLSDRLARAFGGGIGLTLALFLLPMVAVPYLGFGDARYVGTRY